MIIIKKEVINMIKIKNVSKEYVTNSKVVKNLNLEIRPGEIFGFLGPNGAGKTTTLKMMTGVTSITEGSIEINGFDITKEPLEAKKQFGFVPDNPDMFLRLKGIEYLRFMATIYGIDPNTINEKIEDYAKRFEIYDSLNKQINDYSHGMRQKIVLIGALIHEPKIWLLDEPLTGLDPQSSYTLKEMMKEHVRNGNTVLFSTHVLEVAEKIVDRIGIIRKGELIFVGTINELKEKYNASEGSLEELFLELTK
jgi:ABC-2 type transport system ATP-binding protein